MSVAQPSAGCLSSSWYSWPLSLVIVIAAAILWLMLRVVLWLDLGAARPGWGDSLHALALGAVTIKAQPHGWRKRLALIGLGIVLPLAAIQFANLDQSESSNHYAEELAENGLFTFSAAMRRNELDYDKFYATLPEQQAAQVLARLGVHPGVVVDAGRVASQA